jgi:hypothetical protein
MGQRKKPRSDNNPEVKKNLFPQDQNGDNLDADTNGTRSSPLRLGLERYKNKFQRSGGNKLANCTRTGSTASSRRPPRKSNDNKKKRTGSTTSNNNNYNFEDSSHRTSDTMNSEAHRCGSEHKATNQTITYNHYHGSFTGPIINNPYRVSSNVNTTRGNSNAYSAEHFNNQRNMFHTVSDENKNNGDDGDDENNDSNNFWNA